MALTTTLDHKTVPNIQKQNERNWIAVSLETAHCERRQYLKEVGTWRRQLPQGGSYLREKAIRRRELPGETSSYLEKQNCGGN